MYNTVHFIFNIFSSIKMKTNNNYIIYYLTGQADRIRRSPRSVSSNIAEAWRRRRYEGAFIDKLNISESEAAETQVWLEYAVKCKYLDREIGRELNQIYPENRDRKISQYGKQPKTLVVKGKNEWMRYCYMAQWVSFSHFPNCSPVQGECKESRHLMILPWRDL